MEQVVLGSGGVGKSALTLRLITDNFVTEYDPTIEDNYRKPMLIDGQIERLDILDTAGQEEYNSMRDMWYQSGQVFLLVYAVNMRSTFEELESRHDEILIAKDAEDEPSSVPVVLVGNKCDLPESERQVSKADAQELADRWGCPFFEASALAKINDKEVFFQVVREIRKQRAATKSADAPARNRRRRFCAIL